MHSAKATATVDLEPGEAGYDTANDPRSVDYVLSADPDRDLVDLTTYDALGRVVETQRLLYGRYATLDVGMGILIASPDWYSFNSSTHGYPEGKPDAVIPKAHEQLL